MSDAPERGGNVVQLRAAEADTEVQLDEGRPAGAAYVDLTGGDAKRRPIIPDHWSSRENARRHVQLAAARHGHRAAYHSVRAPGYFAKSAGFAVWGVLVVIRRLVAWWHIPGTTALEYKAAADGLLNDHLRLHRQGKETRKARGLILALCLAGVIVAVLVMAVFAPWWAWALAAAAAFVAFALAGRPAGKTITTKAELPADVQPPTPDVIVRALGSLGIAGISQAIRNGEDATFVIKIGRALGVFLILATQRPDKDSLPTGVSGNVSIRFCLKVAGQVENDMILGTSAYKNGARATTFRPKVDAGLGYLKGDESVPQVVRTYYLNTEATERVAKRARALREAAGTLSGVALGADATPKRDVLADITTVFADAAGMHWQPLADRLAERFPERWEGTSGDAVRDECKALGIASVVVVMDGERARGCRIADVERAANGS